MTAYSGSPALKGYPTFILPEWEDGGIGDLLLKGSSNELVWGGVDAMVSSNLLFFESLVSNKASSGSTTSHFAFGKGLGTSYQVDSIVIIFNDDHITTFATDTRTFSLRNEASPDIYSFQLDMISPADTKVVFETDFQFNDFIYCFSDLVSSSTIYHSMTIYFYGSSQASGPL